MNDNVLRQVSHINKCLVAHPTLVRPDIVVMPNVIGQLTGLHKPVQRDIRYIPHLASYIYPGIAFKDSLHKITKENKQTNKDIFSLTSSGSFYLESDVSILLFDGRLNKTPPRPYIDL